MADFTPVSAAIGGALIGLASVLMMLLTGRIAGVSGIFSGVLNLRSEDKGWRIAFIAGLILAPVVAGWIGHGMATPKLRLRPGPTWPACMMPRPAPVMLIQPASAMSLLNSTQAL